MFTGHKSKLVQCPEQDTVSGTRSRCHDISWSSRVEMLPPGKRLSFEDYAKTVFPDYVLL